MDIRNGQQSGVVSVCTSDGYYLRLDIPIEATANPERISIRKKCQNAETKCIAKQTELRG
jgi:hypothetical protein